MIIGNNERAIIVKAPAKEEVKEIAEKEDNTAIANDADVIDSPAIDLSADDAELPKRGRKKKN